ncbi:MAG: TRAP transporter substrate-binding protein [Synergistaceae bacterium]|jgi:tripartite ATP-independent transporter DctP family solute receptor|nr:TRAP transporter substrate-binding protein [Synergistaceae bacterium]
MMKKVLLLAVVALAGALLLTDSEVFAAPKVFDVKISHIVPETDVIHTAYLELKDYLEKESGGRFKVTIYPNRQLSNSNAEDAEKIMANIVQIAAAPTSVLAGSGNIPDFKIFDYPYLFQNSDEIYYTLDHGLGKFLSDKLAAKAGIRIMSSVNGGWCPLSLKTGPLDSPADLKGKKIRILNSDMYMEIMKSFGAVGTPIAYGETYTAMQQGTVDGVTTNFPNWLTERYYEVQKIIGLMNPFAIIHMTMVSDTFYSSLPDDLRTIFDAGMARYDARMRELRAQESIDTMEKLKTLMTVREYTPEELQAFKDASAYILTEKVDLAGKEVMEYARKLLAEYRAQRK